MWNNSVKSSGFTLVELMITLAIAGILVGVGIPSFNSTISSSRLTSYANEFVTALNLARSEAVKRGVRVTLCKSTDSISCTTSSTVNWVQGWIIFTDQNKNAAYDSATETLIRVQSNSNNTSAMVGNTPVADYISYVAIGQTQLTSGAFQAGTIKVCDDRTGNVGINIVLNVVGRISIQKNISCP